jgi:DNA repair exonuclease SbcCD ATPase subunit/DNA-directed RNA polymerase subunit RPC12/RpoP
VPVEDVFAPKTIKPVDPKNAKEKDDSKEDYWERKAREARAYREYMEEQKRLSNLDQPQQPEPPFKMSGELNLGKIDLQEERRQMREEMEQQRRAQEERASKLEQQLEQTKEELYKERVEALRTSFESKMQDLQKTIQQELTKNQGKTFQEQFQELQELAKLLGFEKTRQGQDPMIQLELAKLDYERAREEREFKWKLRQDEKQWQLELQRLQDEREYRRAQLEQQAKKDEMFASFPQHLGSAIARGLLETKGEESIVPKGGQGQHIEAGWGESGEVECPSCGQAMAIGPTARQAVCASCGFKVPIKRVGEKPSGGE